jgi:hypothetical protein
MWSPRRRRYDGARARLVSPVSPPTVGFTSSEERIRRRSGRCVYHRAFSTHVFPVHAFPERGSSPLTALPVSDYHLQDCAVQDHARPCVGHELEVEWEWQEADHGKHRKHVAHKWFRAKILKVRGEMDRLLPPPVVLNPEMQVRVTIDGSLYGGVGAGSRLGAPGQGSQSAGRTTHALSTEALIPSLLCVTGIFLAGGSQKKVPAMHSVRHGRHQGVRLAPSLIDRGWSIGPSAQRLGRLMQAWSIRHGRCSLRSLCNRAQDCGGERIERNGHALCMVGRANDNPCLGSILSNRHRPRS